MIGGLYDNIAAQLHEEHKTKTLRQLGRKYHCSYQTIRHTIIRQGLELHDKRKLRREQLMADWNAGMDAKLIARRYGYSSVDSLHYAVWYHRQSSMNFKRRRA